MYAFQIIRNKETTEHICLICSVSVCRKTSIVIPKWGLGRSPKAGRRDASIHPFPGKGGRGIGIINQKFISKTDFFYKLNGAYLPDMLRLLLLCF